MGTRWEEQPTEQEQQLMDQSMLSRASLGLGATELDLLRNAPDYDAEEMASVHPLGGWPSSLTTPSADPVERPSISSWAPPNRIEPPARSSLPPVEPPARATFPAAAAAAAAAPRARFPEERTMALMAEDLLGRPLDEPEPMAESLVALSGAPRPAWSAAGADMWDSAMPMLVEG